MAQFSRMGIPTSGMTLALDTCANKKDAASTSDIWLIYTSCSMIMGSGTQWMRWRVPPAAGEAEMVVLDAANNQAVYVPLESRLRELGNLKEAGERLELSDEEVAKLGGANVDTGKRLTDTVTGPGAAKTFTVQVSPRSEGFESMSVTAHRYDFDYTGEVAGDMSRAMGEFAPRIVSDGHAYISSDLPGADVFSAFYANFQNFVEPAAATSGTLLAAMIKQMGELASYGVPLHTEQTSRVSVPTPGLAAGFFRKEQKSESTLKAIMVVPSKSSCGPTVIPDGVEVVSLSDMMGMSSAAAGGAAGASSLGSSGSGGSGNTPSQSEMDQAMQQYNEAMQQMTPEQKAMMEKFGMSDMMQQMTGGNPAAQQAPATDGMAGARTMPSSKDLHSENLTEMVQNHLQALGYDPGNTSGEVTLETTIAISQFQAESGLAVTGEVTPQLAGALAAEVDKRRH